MQHGVQLLRHEVVRNVADDGHGETVACDVAEVEADSTSATVARNVARNNFKDGHTMQPLSCMQCCGQCCIRCPRLKLSHQLGLYTMTTNVSVIPLITKKLKTNNLNK